MYKNLDSSLNAASMGPLSVSAAIEEERLKQPQFFVLKTERVFEAVFVVYIANKPRCFHERVINQKMNL